MQDEPKDSAGPTGGIGFRERGRRNVSPVLSAKRRVSGCIEPVSRDRGTRKVADSEGPPSVRYQQTQEREWKANEVGIGTPEHGGCKFVHGAEEEEDSPVGCDSKRTNATDTSHSHCLSNGGK